SFRERAVSAGLRLLIVKREAPSNVVTFAAQSPDDEGRGWMRCLDIVFLLDHLHPILGSAVDTRATVFVAIGTVGAVAYALFRDLFVVPRRRPKLELRFDHSGND